jgi:phytoene synthase
MTTAEAYGHCRQVVREAATTFATGMRLLPPQRREALFAVYALARRIDDIADGPLDPAEKLVQLDRTRTELAHIDDSDDPVLLALADAARRFPIPLTAFDDLLEGAQLDLAGTTYETWAQTEHYCRCVAGSIGRLALGVFETRERGRANVLADDLGVALQLGNIVRDLVEDLATGRLYLPAEDLERFGCARAENRLTGPVELLVAFEAQRGLEWLDRGLQLVPLLDRRSAICVAALSAPYGRLLQHMAVRPEAVLLGRPRLGRVERSLVLARSMIGAAA